MSSRPTPAPLRRRSQDVLLGDPLPHLLTRRGFAQASFVGVASLLLAGCGAGDDEEAELLPTPTKPATPTGDVAGFNDPDRWAGRTLRVGASGGDVQEVLRLAYWEPFAAATGCTIEPVLTDLVRFDETRDDPYADVLLADAPWAERMRRHGSRLQSLDTGLVEPDRADLVVANETALPAYAYGMVSAYRRDAFEDGGPPPHWAAWWDTGQFSGNRTLMKGALGTFEFALLADQVRPEELYPLDGPRAIESLKRISGQIIDRWWETGPQPVGWLGRGRADLGSAWSYRVAAAQIDGWPIEIVWNHGLLLADVWVVPMGARNQDVAMDFLRFGLAPQVQRAMAERIGLGPINSATFDLLDPLMAGALPTSPLNLTRMIRRDVDWWADNDAIANEQFNRWLLGPIR